MAESTEEKVYRLRGYLGILAKKLRVDVQLDMQERLTLQMETWNDAPSVDVEAFYKEGGYFWIPRFFFKDAISRGKMGKKTIHCEWTSGAPVNLPFNALLDPKRGQPKAVERMEAHLRKHSGGILVAPTGCGKTILGYAIGHRLNCPIGVLVYNKQMVKNWMETAEWLFGLSPDEVGLVQGDRCDLGRPVTVMMVQSLLSAKPYPQELYEQFGIIVADEVNRFGAPQWNEVMKLFSARYRVGMSADPGRDDGLEKLVNWHFGEIGHEITGMKRPTPDVVQVLYKKRYHISQYTDPWRKTPSGKPMPNSLKYDRLLMEDDGRNEFLVDELVKARRAKRRILVFSRLKDHLKDLKSRFEDRIGNVLDSLVEATDDSNEEGEYLDMNTSVSLLVGGLKDDALAAAMSADVIFCTFAFGRDAMNIPHIDTLLFATPPGKVLQPIGRLRDKGPEDRRPLLCIDPYEDVDYSRRKADRREATYRELKSKVKRITRTVRDA
jgi:hypothetical protein